MAYCKKFFIILLLLFILLFNFSSCFATDTEDISYDTISGIAINGNTNYFFESSSSSVGYFELEKGYIYHITLNSGNVHYLALSNSVPAVNVPYNYLGTIEAGDTYNYLAQTDDYMYFAFRNSTNITITREKIGNMGSAIDNLAENVGPNALWGVFGNGIDFVFVVVIVAFGIFIIVKLIKGLSKGKSKI